MVPPGNVTGSVELGHEQDWDGLMVPPGRATGSVDAEDTLDELDKVELERDVGEAVELEVETMEEVELDVEEELPPPMDVDEVSDVFDAGDVFGLWKL